MLCGAFVLALILSRPAIAAEALNFPPSDFDILNADTGMLIGHGHYAVDQTAGNLILRGENHYLNGEYDTEEDKLTTAEDSQLPTLTSLEKRTPRASPTLIRSAAKPPSASAETSPRTP